MIGRQKSDISMLSLQRMLEIKGYKITWTMRHKIRKAMAARDVFSRLTGLIEGDDTCFGAQVGNVRSRRNRCGVKGISNKIYTMEEILPFQVYKG